MIPAIDVNALCKTYPEFYLDHLTFTLPQGYILGLVGENGAGKTTTIKSLLHMISPSSGTIRILGHDVAQVNFLMIF